ncbi:hypothetical protein FACS1894145_7030 [Bacteroidia bacterium]|nr:hypothetical protein FACS1894145_7030 [Bacteroidia bacterium]
MKTLKQQLEKRIKTVDDAYKETGRPKVDFSVYPEDLRTNREAEYDAIVIVEAARKIERENGFSEIDWGNNNQWKYIPWFIMSPAGCRFGDSYCDSSNTFAGSGSHLRVLSEEACDYIGKKFLEVWKNVQLK